ncbi:hypothetical protein JOD54_004251 [Actinokineospora baliensis]|uniref:hypothetical protein n=1 Tax=Actinokineospora baliensis TaxID=547056 RepID=UPI0019589797|nr:hypothetical protein [Actinokineospora baliensis]MBM7774047.1 hypothetical protein [Actinokineospora baliensis]
MSGKTIHAALAREALLLRPRTEPDEIRGLWPLVVVAVEDEHEVALAVEHRLCADETAVVLLDGEGHWSVLGDGPLLGLRIAIPSADEVVKIVVPAAPLRDELGLLAAGPTVGLTTVSRARALRDGVDTRTALRSLVLVRSRPAPELAALAYAVAS